MRRRRRDAERGWAELRSGPAAPSVFSMHATKPFATLEGGFIYSSDPERIDELRAMANFGFDRALRDHAGPQCQAERSHRRDGALADRRDARDHPPREALAEAYRASFRNWFPGMPRGSQAHVFLPAFCRHRCGRPGRGYPPGGGRRSRIRDLLRAASGCPALFPGSLHGGPPVTDDVSARILSLPLHEGMTIRDVRRGRRRSRIAAGECVPNIPDTVALYDAFAAEYDHRFDTEPLRRIYEDWVGSGSRRFCRTSRDDRGCRLRHGSHRGTPSRTRTHGHWHRAVRGDAGRVAGQAPGRAGFTCFPRPWRRPRFDRVSRRRAGDGFAAICIGSGIDDAPLCRLGPARRPRLRDGGFEHRSDLRTPSARANGRGAAAPRGAAWRLHLRGRALRAAPVRRGAIRSLLSAPGSWYRYLRYPDLGQRSRTVGLRGRYPGPTRLRYGHRTPASGPSRPYRCRQTPSGLGLPPRP